MNEYSFEVGVRVVVRVQASEPDAARKVVGGFSDHRAARKSNWQIETTKGWAATLP